MYADKEARARAIEPLRRIGASVMEENNPYATLDPSGNRIHLVVET